MSTDRPTRSRRLDRLVRRSDDEGFALPTVIIAMAVLTLFALSSLALVINSAPTARRTADAKSAVAAAQAGIDEYASRLNARPTYYALNGTGVDPDNKAFVLNGAVPFTDGRDPRGVPVPGTGSAGARFSYQVLTTPVETARGGIIRLKVTGTAANNQSRSLTASFGQDGYLRFLYFSDVESLDPSLGVGSRTTTRDGSVGYYVDPPRNTVVDSFKPDPAIFADSCSRHWYDEGGVPGRSRGFSYRSSASKPYIITREDANPPNDRVMTDAHDIAFSCTEIQFAARDVITGPLHTNDAILLGGAATFQNPQTETSWGDDSAPAPANPTRRWRPGGYAGTPIGTQPYYAPVQSIPRSNSRLRAQASVDNEGCLYSGATSIRFDGTTMYVKSPGTTSAGPGCGTGSWANEKAISPAPAVVYVQNSTGACRLSDLDWPKAGESVPASTTSTTNPAGGTTTSYDCKAGNAFVSGTLRGQTTVATENDIIVTGDLTYGGELAGEDVLGLIPNNYVWVYHPVKANGDELPGAGPRVRRIDAAILSLNRSFLVQNWNKGATDSPTLQVNGVIAQKFRGPVGTGSGTGYAKDYRYDTRLRYLPPPYFLTPVDSPWTVQTTTDG